MPDESQNSDDSWYLGQKIRITHGPYAGFEGEIYLIDRKQRIVRVKIDFFTRPTPVELPFSSLEALG